MAAVTPIDDDGDEAEQSEQPEHGERMTARERAMRARAAAAT